MSQRGSNERRKDLMVEDVQERPTFPLGEIIAERRFTLFEKSGVARQVAVQIGKSVPVDLQGDILTVAGAEGHFRCLLPSLVWV
jgi:hypothetical protein